MEIEYYLSKYEYFVSLGYVVIIASILTMIITQIIKKILQKKKVITQVTNETRIDIMLTKIGRIVALLTYTLLYLGNELILKNTIVIDKGLIVALLSGSALTLTIAKGIYTSLHQYFKKQEVFKLLEEEKQVNKWIIRGRSNEESSNR